MTDAKAASIRGELNGMGCSCPANLEKSCACAACAPALTRESNRRRDLAQSLFVSAFSVNSDLKGWLYARFDGIPTDTQYPNELEKAQKVAVQLIQFQELVLAMSREIQARGYGAIDLYQASAPREAVAVAIRSACDEQSNRHACAQGAILRYLGDVSRAMRAMASAASHASWHRYADYQCSLPGEDIDDFLNPAAPSVVATKGASLLTPVKPPDQNPAKVPKPVPSPSPTAPPPPPPSCENTGSCEPLSNLPDVPGIVGRLDGDGGSGATGPTGDGWSISPDGEPGELPPGPVSGVPGGIPGIDYPIWGIPGVVDSGDGPPAKGVPAPTQPPPRRPIDPNSATKLLQAALLARDQQKGYTLPPQAGTVNSAVQAAVRASDATPLRGSASYQIVVNASGAVTSVALLGSQGGSPADWSSAVAGIRSSLAGRNLDIDREVFSNGYRVVVTVSSSVRTPSGQEVGAGPEVSASEVSPGVSLSFDLSDIGGGSSRVVHSRFSVTPL